MCPPCVHINAHCWLWCARQTHRPLPVFSSAWEFTLLTQSDPAFVVCSVRASVCPRPSFSWPVSWCVSTSQSLWDAFSRLHFQVPAWAARLWWWAMCKAAFSNLIKGPRYSPLKQRALEAWRNDSGKSTALICKNLHLLAGRGNAGRRGRGNGRRLPLESLL